jgi:hypothetical protein
MIQNKPTHMFRDTLKFRQLIIFSGCLLLFPVSELYAQEATINQDVRVVREYNPTVSDAFKINEMPDPKQDEIPAPEFRYRLTGKAIIGAPEIVPLVPARLAKEPREELYPNYLQGYLGNYEVIGGRILYNLVQNEKFALSLKAGHESSFGDLELENKMQTEAHYHQSHGGLNFRHFFSKKTMSIDMDFNNHIYQYFGLQTINPEETYMRPPLNPVSSIMDNVSGSELIPDNKQRQTAFDMDLGLLNHVNGNSNTRYDLMMGFSTFGNRTGVKENEFRLKGDFEVPVGELFVRLETSMNHASASHAENDMPYLYNFQKRQQTLVQVNPAMVRKNKNLTLKMGLRIAGEFDDLEDNFYLSPDVTADLLVAEGIISLHGGITGEITPSTYRGIMAENPFVAPDVNVKTAFHGVRFFGGITGNFSRATSFSANVAYSAFTNEHFFENRTFDAGTISDPQRVHYSNLFDVVYDDGRLLTVSGEFKMKFIPELDIVLRGAYYGWELDSLNYAYHKPDMEVGIRTAWRINNSLTLTASANLLGKRYAEIPGETKELDPVYDFNLGANYNLNKRWHFFGNVQNMLASKYYRWNGYPMHGVNARVGVGYSF